MDQAAPLADLNDQRHVGAHGYVLHHEFAGRVGQRGRNRLTRHGRGARFAHGTRADLGESLIGNVDGDVVESNFPLGVVDRGPNRGFHGLAFALVDGAGPGSPVARATDTRLDRPAAVDVDDRTTAAGARTAAAADVETPRSA